MHLTGSHNLRKHQHIQSKIRLLYQMRNMCERGNGCESSNGQTDVEQGWLAVAYCVICSSPIYYNSGGVPISWPLVGLAPDASCIACGSGPLPPSVPPRLWGGRSLLVEALPGPATSPCACGLRLRAKLASGMRAVTRRPLEVFCLARWPSTRLSRRPNLPNAVSLCSPGRTTRKTRRCEPGSSRGIA